MSADADIVAIMRSPDSPDLNPFLRHLEARDPEAAAFARELSVTPGWRVTDFVGPIQMDVWQLVFERHGWTVRFGVERGVSDGMLARHQDVHRHLGNLAQAREWLAGID